MKLSLALLVALLLCACDDGEVGAPLDAGTPDARSTLDAMPDGSGSSDIDASVIKAARCEQTFTIERLPDAGTPGIGRYWTVILTPGVTVLDGGTTRIAMSYYAQVESTPPLPPGIGPISVFFDLASDCSLSTRHVFAPDPVTKAGVFASSSRLAADGRTALLALARGGRFDLGLGPIEDDRAALVVLDAAFVPLWMRPLGKFSSVSGYGFDAAGNLYMLLRSDGPLDLVGDVLSVPIESARDQASYLLKYDAAGALSWSKRLLTGERTPRLAIAADGQLALVGELDEMARPEDPLRAGLTLPEQGRALLVAKLGADGALRWNRLLALGGPYPDHTLALDPAGNLWVRFDRPLVGRSDRSSATAVFADDGTQIEGWPDESLATGSLTFAGSDVIHTYDGRYTPGEPDWSNGGDWTARRGPAGEFRWRYESAGRFSSDARSSVSVGPRGEVALATWEQFLPNPRLHVVTLDP